MVDPAGPDSLDDIQDVAEGANVPSDEEARFPSRCADGTRSKRTGRSSPCSMRSRATSTPIRPVPPVT